MNFSLRKANEQDVPTLRKLIDASVRGLQSSDYSPTQIESALATVYGVDSQLIADGTYFVVRRPSRKRKSSHVGAGANARLSTVAIAGRDARTVFSIPRKMQPRSAPSSFILIGFVGGSEPSCSMPASMQPWWPDFVASKWERHSVASRCMRPAATCHWRTWRFSWPMASRCPSCGWRNAFRSPCTFVPPDSTPVPFTVFAPRFTL